MKRPGVETAKSVGGAASRNDGARALAALQERIAPLVAAAGLDLIELRVQRAGAVHIAVFVDRLPGMGAIDVEDCAGLSRKISTSLEADDPIAGAWDLEVSSPGSKRLLRHGDDMRRYLGVRARLQLGGDPLRAVARETIVGELLAVEVGADGVEVVAVGLGGDRQRRVALPDVQRAQLDPTFEQWQALGRKVGLGQELDPGAEASHAMAPNGVPDEE